MSRTWNRRALATMGGALAVGLVAAGPASAAQLDWELQYTLDRSEENRVSAVDAAAPDDVWAVGRTGPWDDSSPVALHYDGNRWAEVDTPLARGVQPVGVDATSSGSAWVTVNDADRAGADDAVLRWKDGGWEVHGFPGSRGGALAAVSDTDVWYAAGNRDTGGTASHYDGQRWRSMPLPGEGVMTINRVLAVGSDDVWAVGAKADQPYAAHWDGESWQEVSPAAVTPPPGDDEYSAWLSGVTVAGGKLWAVGLGTGDTRADGLFYTFDGSGWQPKKLPDLAYGVGADTAAEGPDGRLWLSNADGNYLYRRTADGWAKVEVPEQDRTALGIRDFTSADGQVWVVGTAAVSDVAYHGVVYQGS